MSQEEDGFTLHFGDQDDWENVSIENLKLDASPSIVVAEDSNIDQPSVPDSLDGEIPGQQQQSIIPPEPSNSNLVDPMLIEALETPSKRMMVLKYEDSILSFVRDKSKETFTFPQMSSYQRLLIHRLSDRFNLDREAVDMGGFGGFNGGNSNGEYEQPIRSITLMKTLSTCIPPLLINQNADQSQQTSEPVAQPQILNVTKMLKRNPKGPGENKKKSRGGHQNASKRDSSNMTMMEREALYAAAKARIFGEDGIEDELSRTPSPAQPSNMAKGPESSGSIGFGANGMGRGLRSSSDPNVGSSGPSSTNERSQSDSSSQAHQNSDNEQFLKARESPPQRPNSGSGKVKGSGRGGPKRVSQNRQVDMHDPDFVRLDNRAAGKGMTPQSYYPVQPPGYYDSRLTAPPLNGHDYTQYDQCLRPSQIPPPGMYSMAPRPTPPPATAAPYGYGPQGQPLYSGTMPSQFIYPPDYNTQQGMYSHPPMSHDTQPYGGGRHQYQQPRPQQPHHSERYQDGRSQQRQNSSKGAVSLEDFPALS